MKAINFFIMIITISLLSITFTNCGETDNESCKQDEICTGKNVTSCCTSDNVCVFKYNGKEYTEDQVDLLADDLGCTGGGARVAAAEKEQLMNQLQELLNQARAGLNN